MTMDAGCGREVRLVEDTARFSMLGDVGVSIESYTENIMEMWLISCTFCILVIYQIVVILTIWKQILQRKMYKMRLLVVEWSEGQDTEVR
jgi:hypothetical protein